jgi:hypothetical protein
MLEDVLKKFLDPRMPPGTDAHPYARIAARRFRPRDFGALRRPRHLDAIKYSSLEVIVPPWLACHSDPIERDRGGRYLRGRHAKKNPPEMHQRLADLPDEFQWAYLLHGFQSFTIEQTSTIVRTSQEWVESLFGKAHSAVHLIPPGNP